MLTEPPTCRRGQSARHRERSWVMRAVAPPSSPYLKKKNQKKIQNLKFCI
jgi:hypothetical protein